MDDTQLLPSLAELTGLTSLVSGKASCNETVASAAPCIPMRLEQAKNNPKTRLLGQQPVSPVSQSATVSDGRAPNYAKDPS